MATIFRGPRLLYVYLRCDGPIDDNDAASDAADEMFAEPSGGEYLARDQAEIMSMGDDFYSFSDGVVVRLRSNKELSEIASEWSGHLSNFVAWAIHDGKGDVVEGGGESLGQVKAALTRTARKGVPVTQAFLHHGSDYSDEVTQSIRSALASPSQAAFHFGNGSVLFVAPPDAAATLIERMHAKLPRLRRSALKEVAFDDGDGGQGQQYFEPGWPWSPYEFE